MARDPYLSRQFRPEVQVSRALLLFPGLPLSGAHQSSPLQTEGGGWNER